jgi:hypothetical protein
MTLILNRNPMYVPEIIEVKDQLQDLKQKNIIKEWELPYENLLTRRSAAIFFLTPFEEKEELMAFVWETLEKYPNFSQRLNEEKKLSNMKFRITFSAEEKEKNEQKAAGLAAK